MKKFTNTGIESLGAFRLTNAQISLVKGGNVGTGENNPNDTNRNGSSGGTQETTPPPC